MELQERTEIGKVEEKEIENIEHVTKHLQELVLNKNMQVLKWFMNVSGYEMEDNGKGIIVTSHIDMITDILIGMVSAAGYNFKHVRHVFGTTKIAAYFEKKAE